MHSILRNLLKQNARPMIDNVRCHRYNIWSALIAFRNKHKAVTVLKSCLQPKILRFCLSLHSSLTRTRDKGRTGYLEIPNELEWLLANWVERRKISNDSWWNRVLVKNVQKPRRILAASRLLHLCSCPRAKGWSWFLK